MTTFKDWGFSEVAVKNIILAFLCLSIACIGILYNANAELRIKYEARIEEANQRLLQCEVDRRKDVTLVVNQATSMKAQYDSVILVMIRRISDINRGISKSK